MKIFEHKDFEQAILGAEQHFRERKLRPAIIEKDYYVTEALRIIAAAAPDKIIFKGGTSLAKGWNLIQRFSEDIDIFLDPRAFKPALGKNGVDRELKRLRDAVDTHPALTFVQEESKTIGGFGRNDRFSYTQRFGGTGEVANRVLLEAGTASGREPTTVIELRSYLGQFLEETRTSLGADDEGRFPLRLLHFRRTFVEKMFAIHSKLEILKRDKTPPSTREDQRAKWLCGSGGFGRTTAFGRSLALSAHRTAGAGWRSRVYWRNWYSNLAAAICRRSGWPVAKSFWKDSSAMGNTLRFYSGARTGGHLPARRVSTWRHHARSIR